MDERHTDIERLIDEIERQRRELRHTQAQLQASLQRLSATVEKTRHSVVTFYTAIGEVDAYFTPRLTSLQYAQVVSLVEESFDTPAEVLGLLREVTPLWDVDVTLSNCV